MLVDQGKQVGVQASNDELAFGLGKYRLAEIIIERIGNQCGPINISPVQNKDIEQIVMSIEHNLSA